MPFAFVIFGLAFIITGVNNTYAQLGTQIKSDFTGKKSFLGYIVALGAVGALGYINDFRKFSHYFMALILISIILANGGFFAKFTEAVNGTPVQPEAGNASSNTTSNPTISSQIPSSVTDAFGPGNNPGSDMIGTAVTKMTNSFKGLFGF